MRTRIILVAMLMTGCTIGAEQTSSRSGEQRWHPPTKSEIECGPAPEDPAWSAHVEAGPPAVAVIPEAQWEAIASYMAATSDWVLCIKTKLALK